ncbi:hypothetical protein [Streptomyces sp. NPDC059009]|uniref:hypothetical protein n=1 Tax=Streptomyces sp. NPDC059009 TaxID=3346694 RepID=UPI0036B232D9
MFTPWRSAALYAAVITAGSAAIGALVEAAWLLASGPRTAEWGTMLIVSHYQLAFLPLVFVALTVARKVCAALPRWRVIVTDCSLYGLTLLLAAFLVTLPDGVTEAADAPFVVGFLAMFNLQIPAALLLSGWASGRLTLAMRARERTFTFG